MRRNRKVRIIATLGPSSSTHEMIKQLVISGADVFRLNASHGTHEGMREKYNIIRQIEQELDRPIGILLDLQGPKLRVGMMQEGVVLQNGQEFNFDLNPEIGNAQRAPLLHPEIFAALVPGARLLINDGKISVKVLECTKEYAKTEVINGGALSSKKGVNVPDVILPVSALTDKDEKDLRFALELGVDWIALSFVQKPEDVTYIKSIVQGRAGVMAKIEKPGAIMHLKEIFETSDAVMVARGDLGVELPLEDVPSLQRKMVRMGHLTGKPVVIATQMLESMIDNPVPTRAEVSDVATAVYEGTDAIMLSAESAAGQFPLEAVAVMNRVAEKVEKDSLYREHTENMRCPPENTPSDAITAAARQVAKTINAKVIVTHTSSGSTAMRASRERPSVPILAMTPVESVARRLTLVWGLTIAQTGNVSRFKESVENALQKVEEFGMASNGDKIVVTAGVPFGRSGTTNILRIAQVGEFDH
ncbi:MAG: pyruvate kinase [Alphaproteobacteria bacterium]|jgi:pyruvate kinase